MPFVFIAWYYTNKPVPARDQRVTAKFLFSYDITPFN